MLPSRREHRFPQISVSAISFHLALKIGSENDLNCAEDAPQAPQERSQTRPKRFESASRRSWRRFLAVPEGLGTHRARLGVLCALFFGPLGFTKALRKRSGLHFGIVLLTLERECRSLFPQTWTCHVNAGFPTNSPARCWLEVADYGKHCGR